MRAKNFNQKHTQKKCPDQNTWERQTPMQDVLEKSSCQTSHTEKPGGTCRLSLTIILVYFTSAYLPLKGLLWLSHADFAPFHYVAEIQANNESNKTAFTVKKTSQRPSKIIQK